MSQEIVDQLKKQNLKAYLEKRGHEFEKNLTLCPFHADSKPSLSVSCEDGIYLWFCHSCRMGGSIIDYVIQKDDLSKGQAIAALMKEFGIEEEKQEEVCRYRYVDEYGNELYQIIRYKPKTFVADRKLGDTPIVPYHYDFFKKNETIWMVEGEKDADALVKLGIMATTMPFGVNNWKKEYGKYFQYKNVIICLDKGRIKESSERADNLIEFKAKSVKLIDLDGLKPEEDISDWLKTGTKERLLEIVEKTKHYVGKSATGLSTVDMIEVANVAKDMEAMARIGDEKGIELMMQKLGRLRPSKVNLSKEIKEWINEQGGYTWSLRNVRADLHITRKNEKDLLRRVVSDLGAAGVIEPGERQGEWRKKLDNLNEIKWWKAPTDDIPIILPFGMHEYVKIFPGNIIVYAGVQGHGKTAAILDTIRRNITNSDLIAFYKAYLKEGESIFNVFNSEAGDSEIRERIELISDIDLEIWINLVRIWERSEEFHTVIKPNAINFVDYLEVNQGEFFKIGHYLRKIHDKLDRGIAIIGLQKEAGAKLGYGAGKSLEKPRLYVNFESGELKIVKAKNWQTRLNPVGMTAKFRLVDGNKFIIDEPLHHGKEVYS